MAQRASHSHADISNEPSEIRSEMAATRAALTDKIIAVKERLLGIESTSRRNEGARAVAKKKTVSKAAKTKTKAKAKGKSAKGKSAKGKKAGGANAQPAWPKRVAKSRQRKPRQSGRP